MAATGIGNPVGAVMVADGGTPRIVGGLARAQTVSGGVYVFTSGASGVVSSGANSYATADVLFTIDASGALFNGIALQSAGSNEPLSVASRGMFLLVCSGNVISGYPVKCDGSNAVEQVAATEGDLIIGRAFTEGTSGGYCLVDIHG